MVLGISPNSNANPKPNPDPDPDRGAILFGGNFPDTGSDMGKKHFVKIVKRLVTVYLKFIYVYNLR